MAHFRLDATRVLTVNVPDQSRLFQTITARWQRGEGFTLATLNLDHLVKLRRDAAFRDAYTATDLVTADGKPVTWLTRLGGSRVALVTGSDLVEPLCRLAAREGIGVAFVGPTVATLRIAVDRLKAGAPELSVALLTAPSFGFDPTGAEADAIIGQIGDSGARLCLLAFGCPKQEIFAVRARAAVPGCGFVSVGAGIDFVAGAQRRAPRWMRALAFEWVWRMLRDPRRLAWRYLACGLLMPVLTLEMVRDRLRGAAQGN